MTHTTSAAKEQFAQAALNIWHTTAMCGKAAHFQQDQKDCHPLTCQPQPDQLSMSTESAVITLLQEGSRFRNHPCIHNAILRTASDSSLAPVLCSLISARTSSDPPQD